MQNNDFFIEKQKAVERMKQMQRRSVQSDNPDMPPTPFFVSTDRAASGAKRQSGSNPITHGKKSEQPSDNSSGHGFPDFHLPFFEKNDPDVSLLLGLFLLLSSEKADKILLYALLYILM